MCSIQNRSPNKDVSDLLEERVHFLRSVRRDSNQEHIPVTRKQKDAKRSFQAITDTEIVRRATEFLEGEFLIYQGSQISVLQLINCVAMHYGVTVDEVLSSKRLAQYVFPRQLVMYLLVKKFDISTVKVGTLLKRDHTTVMHGCNTIDHLMRESIALQDQLNVLLEKIGLVSSHQSTQPTLAVHLSDKQEIEVKEVAVSVEMFMSPQDTKKYQALVSAYKSGRLQQLRENNQGIYHTLVLRFDFENSNNPQYRTPEEVGKMVGGVSGKRILFLENDLLKRMGLMSD